MSGYEILVYGGSFNPFGRHHQKIVSDLVGKGYRVIVVPSAAHALKPNLIDFVHRYNMTKLALPPGAEISAIEMEMLETHTAPIYTYPMLLEMRKKVGSENHIRFVIGPDVADELHKWTFVDETQKEFGFYLLEDDKNQVRSTQLRAWIKDKNPIWESYVPPEVVEYIKRQRLYL